jgi:hypothetical protein
MASSNLNPFSFFQTPDGIYSAMESNTVSTDDTAVTPPIPQQQYPTKLSIVSVNYSTHFKEVKDSLGLGNLVGLQRGTTLQKRAGDNLNSNRPTTGNSTSSGSDSISPIKRKALSSFSIPKLASLTSPSNNHNNPGDLHSSRPVRNFRGSSSSFVR